MYKLLFLRPKFCLCRNGYTIVNILDFTRINYLNEQSWERFWRLPQLNINAHPMRNVMYVAIKLVISLFHLILILVTCINKLIKLCLHAFHDDFIGVLLVFLRIDKDNVTLLCDNRNHIFFYLERFRFTISLLH